MNSEPLHHRSPTFADAASRTQIARMTARILFATGAVRLNVDAPFVFSSGWASPVYVECQRVMAHPDLRQTLMALAAGEIERRVGVTGIDTVVGGEDAGVCFAAWIADALRKPLNFVRTRTRGFGRNAQIEGELHSGARALLVGDLTTDGVSKAQFATALRAAGAIVHDVFVLFYFDVFDDARPHLDAAGLRLHALANWADIVAVAREDGLFDTATLAEVEGFRADPAGWSARHGGLAHLPPPLRTSLP